MIKTIAIRKNRNKSKLTNSNKLRVLVYRSNLHIYAVVINESGKILACASDLKYTASGCKIEKAQKVGNEIAEKISKLGIKQLVFDRNGRKYHGRVKAVANSIRQAGFIL